MSDNLQPNKGGDESCASITHKQAIHSIATAHSAEDASNAAPKSDPSVAVSDREKKIRKEFKSEDTISEDEFVYILEIIDSLRARAAKAEATLLKCKECSDLMRSATGAASNEMLHEAVLRVVSCLAHTERQRDIARDALEKIKLGGMSTEQAIATEAHNEMKP